jgi:hypothetical protein
VESAVAVKNVCGLVPKLRWRLIWMVDGGNIAGVILIFRTVLTVSEEFCASHEKMIRKVHLPRLDAMIEEETPLAEAYSRANGGPAGMAAAKAAGPAAEHVREVMAVHMRCLRALRSTLEDASDSMTERFNEALDSDAWNSMSFQEKKRGGSPSPGRAMREAAGLLKARINGLPDLAGACGWGGREDLVSEIDELLVKVPPPPRG